MEQIVIDDIDRELMKEALITAEKGYESGEVPVGCVFVQFSEEDKEKYEIVARSHNLTTELSDATKHCEIICITKILKEKNFNYDRDKQFSNLVLYVTVEPCIMCGYALNLINIKRVYFGCANDRFGGNGSVLNTHQMAPNKYQSIGGILEKEAMNVLKNFYEKGNENLPEELRHRNKKIKTEDQNMEEGKQKI